MAKVTRSSVAGILLPDDISETLIRGAYENSIVQSYAKAVPMNAVNKVLKEAEVGGANAYWVGEGQRKTTDAPSMTQKVWTMTAAELAVLIPLDEDVSDDVDVDLFGLYKPEIETAFAKKLDAAAIFGTDKPTAWGTLGTDIIPNAVVAGNDFQEDGSPTDAELLNLIGGTGASTPDGALQAIEDDGYEATGFVGHIRFKSRLRGLKDADNRYIFGDGVVAGVPNSLFGIPLAFAKREVWPAPTGVVGDAHLILGDWDQAIVGTRAGIRYKVFTEGTITDGAGNVVYSLMESDMVVLRVTQRLGFKVICDNTADGETLADGEDFPFAVVQPAIA